LLQALLEREYRVSGSALLAEVVNASSFEEVIRAFIANNFDHHAPGNIVPVLMSQPELAAKIKQLRKQTGKQTANFLVENTAKNYKLNVEQAQLAITMSSGASVAAAEWVAMNQLDRERAIDMVLAYIKSGMEGLGAE
jgi:hypothetical protein